MSWSSKSGEWDEAAADLAAVGISSGRAWWAVIVPSLLGAVLASYLLLLLIGPAAAQPVPPVVGSSLSGAKKKLASQGLGLMVADRRPDPHVPAGAVALQEPVAGALLKPGQVVLVTVSTGGSMPHSVPTRR